MNSKKIVLKNEKNNSRSSYVCLGYKSNNIDGWSQKVYIILIKLHMFTMDWAKLHHLAKPTYPPPFPTHGSNLACFIWKINYYERNSHILKSKPAFYLKFMDLLSLQILANHQFLLNINSLGSLFGYLCINTMYIHITSVLQNRF